MQAGGVGLEPCCHGDGILCMFIGWLRGGKADKERRLVEGYKAVVRKAAINRADRKKFSVKHRTSLLFAL